MNDSNASLSSISNSNMFSLAPIQEVPSNDIGLKCKKAAKVVLVSIIGVPVLGCFGVAFLLLCPAGAKVIVEWSHVFGSLSFTALTFVMAFATIAYRRAFLPPPTHLIVSPKRIVSVQSLDNSKWCQDELKRLANDNSYKGNIMGMGAESFGVLANVNWEDMIRVSGSVDKNGSQLLCFRTSKGKVVKMRLGDRLGNESRKALLDGLKQWAPNAICEPEAQALLEPRPETSYTELWISALSAPPERNRIAPLESGVTICNGKYEIESQLGAGGQAVVYLAQETGSANGREVVLKEYILPIGVTRKATKEAIEVLENEAKLLERLDHPQIVKLLNFFVEDHRGYMVFERVAGENLRELVRRDGVLSEKKVRDIAIKVCHILQYLHLQEPPVLHKDLSPDNLILNENGEPKLIDFAVAQQMQVTATALAQGKRSYMPPEQFRGKPSVQSDLYALGCSIYFLAVGDDPEPLSVSHPKLMRSELSDGLDFIVAGCTQLDTSARYKSAQQVLSDLEKL